MVCLQQAAFKEAGGQTLKHWIDRCPNSDYCALTFQGASAWRARLRDDIGGQGDVIALLDRRSDEELHKLMTNLGGHCQQSLLNAFTRAPSDRPIAFIAYTIKGWGTPLAGHKDNHSGLMTTTQMNEFRHAMNIEEGHEWEKFSGIDEHRPMLEEHLAQVPFFQQPNRAPFRQPHLHPRPCVP